MLSVRSKLGEDFSKVYVERSEKEKKSVGLQSTVVGLRGW